MSRTVSSRSSKEQYRLQTVERAIEILNLLSAEEELSLTEISSLLGLHPSTIFRFLTTLESRNCIEKNVDNGRYRLGVGCLMWGSAFLNSNDLRRCAIPLMETLRDDCSETVHLGILMDNEVVYVEKLAGLHPIGLMSSRVGGRSPLYCTGLGKAMLAQLSENALQQYLRNHEFRRYTQQTITDPDGLMNELSKIRELGYAIDNEEHEFSVVCVGAPIMAPYGLAGAISASGPRDRVWEAISNKDLTNRVKGTANRISFKLGA